MKFVMRHVPPSDDDGSETDIEFTVDGAATVKVWRYYRSGDIESTTEIELAAAANPEAL